MPIVLFEILCVAIIASTLFTMSRTRPLGGRRGLLADYLTLAVAGWIGEESCIAFYEFYGYAPDWHLRIDHVPALVPLIWPLVILSAREVAQKLFPGARPGRRALIVGVIVAVDASLVEVLAVRAGLWAWAEPGHLDVPLIGMLGWGFFAAAATVLLARENAFRPLTVLVGAPLVTHLLILTTWWGCFRWTLRGDLGTASVVAVAVIGLALTVSTLLLRRRDRFLDLQVAVNRMIAATLFVALFLVTDPGNIPLWTHTLAVAVPYLAATRFVFGGAVSTATAAPTSE